MKYEAKSGDVMKVHYDVPYLAQKRNMSCWYACSKMVFAFRRPPDAAAKIKSFLIVENAEKKAAIEALLIKSQPLISKEQTENIGATEKDWPLIAEAFGFSKLTETEAGDAAKNFDKLVLLLQKYGPMWSAGRFYQDGNQKAGHVIVLVGAFVRGGKNYVIFHDPAPENQQGGPNSIKQYDLYFKARDSKFNGLYTWEETNGEAPMMYKVAK